METSIESELAELSTGWQSILPDVTHSETLLIEDYSSSLKDAERAHLEGASTRRMAEFSTSREAFRRIQIKAPLIYQDNLLSGEEGMPIWSPKITGSISHSKGLCSVACAKRSELESLGIDLEKRGRLKDKLWAKIATKEEVTTVERFATDNQLSIETAMTILFSLKESFYKFHFPMHRTWLGFLDVSFLETDTGYTLKVLKNTANPEISWSFATSSNYVQTAVWNLSL